VVVLLLAEFGSLVVAAMDEFAVIEATVMVDARFTTTTIFADAAVARLAVTQLIVPVAPTAGVVHVQFAGIAMEAKVVFVGTASVKVRLEAVAGPLLVTV
jgi:acyl-CoA hydrolase